MRGAELIAEFLKHSPFVAHLRIELREIEDDRAVLALPFREEVVTIGDVVHGGAVSALLDTAAMAASWSAIEFEGEPPRGTTVGLSVDFLAAARAQGLLAEATVLRRGASLCFCEVKVRGADDGALVATGLVTYKLSDRS
ncbi:MAG TPA: PaaI family thioesterase [Solirubrobacterales bacterium]|nr:PaaI family thioesterase [Solirubrobacterales bacterium]